ncbi:hypothetical protein BST61_g5553 [Cercospora zeina]
MKLPSPHHIALAALTLPVALPIFLLILIILTTICLPLGHFGALLSKILHVVLPIPILQRYLDALESPFSLLIAVVIWGGVWGVWKSSLDVRQKEFVVLQWGGLDVQFAVDWAKGFVGKVVGRGEGGGEQQQQQQQQQQRRRAEGKVKGKKGKIRVRGEVKDEENEREWEQGDDDENLTLLDDRTVIHSPASSSSPFEDDRPPPPTDNDFDFGLINKASLSDSNPFIRRMLPRRQQQQREQERMVTRSEFEFTPQKWRQRQASSGFGRRTHTHTHTHISQWNEREGRWGLRESEDETEN